MPRRAAGKMDPRDDMNSGGDSNFHLILKALERGYELYHYDVRGLTWEAGRLTTKAHRIVEAQRAAGAHFKFGDEILLDLGRDVDVVLMRQDPPFDLGYLTGTWLLERSEEHTSELQSLMRISYAVFCLNKKTQQTTQHISSSINH